MEFCSTGSIAEALASLDELGEGAQILAGGTDVMIQYSSRQISPSALVHIGRIPGLDLIESNAAMSIGPLTTHRKLATDPDIAAGLPALREAAATVGGWQTQEVGTVGGNLCTASPAADTAPPLLVADAVAELTSLDGTREVPLHEFFLGRRQTARRSGEILTGITAKPIQPGTTETYLKLGRRSAMEVAIVGLAVRLTADEADRITSARIAVCSVAPQPYRAFEAEAALEGNQMGSDVIGEAGELLAASSSPIDDARATAKYRRSVLPRLLSRAVDACLQHRERSNR